jgi:hypothetical protein
MSHRRGGQSGRTGRGGHDSFVVMASAAERVSLCLSLIGYAGFSGEPARAAPALHRTLAMWLARLPATREHEIVWGPASFRAWWQPSSPALVVFVTRPRGEDDCYIVVRGSAPMAIWDHHVESLGCLEQEPWLWARGSGNLAPAVCAGIRRLLDVICELTPEEQLPGAGRGLTEFLADRIAELDGDRKLPVHVVGHGVGGGLATAVALWLHDTQGGMSARDLDWDPRQGAKIHCTAFASPTIGNGDFASYVSDRLDAQLDLVFNSLDHVAMLWDPIALAGIADLYRPHVQEVALVRAIADALVDEIERRGLEYEQPPARVLDGRLNTTLPPTFAAQAEYQHLHAYVELLGLGAQLDVDAIFERPSGINGGPVAQ